MKKKEQQEQNPFLKFYGEHHISPVSQDITDFELHLRRRIRLYELVGIHPFAFRNASVLEVGAGSGYNTLLFLKLGANVDIVEPNAAGRESMEGLFREYNIPDSQFSIYPCTLQEYKNIKQYDFVIAEGFLPWIGNIERKEIISKLLYYTKIGGGIVTTTVCEFSFFFEDLRRILGLVLVKNIKSFEDKVAMLSKAFKSHLDSLIFASRPINDWVSDNILNPAAGTKNLLNLKDCVVEFTSINATFGDRGGACSKCRF